jgi:hypothetical protein
MEFLQRRKAMKAIVVEQAGPNISALVGCPNLGAETNEAAKDPSGSSRKDRGSGVGHADLQGFKAG